MKITLRRQRVSLRKLFSVSLLDTKMASDCHDSRKNSWKHFDLSSLKAELFAYRY